MNAKQISLTAILCLVIALSLLACGSQDKLDFDPDENDQPPVFSVKPLKNFESCTVFNEEARTQLKTYVEGVLDNYLSCAYYTYSDDDQIGATEGTVTASSDAAEASGTSYTDTNIQEAGVDEADLIKTDGTYIYVATMTGLDIIRAWPLGDFGKVANLETTYPLSNLYLQDSEIIATSYGYDDVSQNFYVRLDVISVADPENPFIKSSQKIAGFYVDSRFVEGTLHLITNSYLNFSFVYPVYEYADYEASCSGDAMAAQRIEKAVEEARAANNLLIEDWSIENVLSISVSDDSQVSVDCDSLYSDNDDVIDSFTSLYSYNLEYNVSKLSVIKGYTQTVYSSTHAVYFAGANWTEDATYIHKFSINSDWGNQYVSSGAVAGHVLNQFSMSEYDDHFRIATSYGSVSSSGNPVVYSNVFVLDTEGSEMTVTGQVTHLAEGETIYAVRFLEDKGYLITFEKVDPLFVIDVSDATNPQVQGELKMPGYSTYLHPVGSDHLLGLGKDAEDMGSFSWFQGLKLALFDVSDGYAPSIVDDLIIGSRGTDSYALYDHHAFTYNADSQLLALPLALYEDSSGESDYGDFAYYGVHVYHVDTETGVDIVAEVALPEEFDGPIRTLMIQDEEEAGLFVLGSHTLYVLDMNHEYELLDSSDLDPVCLNCGEYGVMVGM